MNILSIQFRRKYKLTVGSPTLKGDLETKGKEFILTNHNVNFAITKSNSPVSNSAVITIHNSSDKLVNYLAQYSGLSCYVKLEVGYEGTPLKELFVGTLLGAFDNFDEVNRTTELKCADGYVQFKERRTKRAYPKGTPYKKMVDDLIVDVGLTKGIVVIPEGVTKNYRAFNGSIRQALTSLSKDLNCNFSVQDQRVFFSPYDYKSDVIVKVINSRSGMIGAPSIIDTYTGDLQNKIHVSRGLAEAKEVDQEKEGEKAKEATTRVKCLLDASVRPDSFIKIESKRVNGVFKVVQVSFSGEFEGQSWEMDIECRRII